MKRLTAQARLQHPVTDQILSAKGMMKFCDESINGIKFVYTPFEAFASIKKCAGQQVHLPGTRSYRQFEASTDSAIKMKHIL